MKVVAKAIEACDNSGNNPDDHIVEFNDMVLIGSGQAYFAVQTRLQELQKTEQYNTLDTELAANLFRATQTEEKLKQTKHILKWAKRYAKLLKI